MLGDARQSVSSKVWMRLDDASVMIVSKRDCFEFCDTPLSQAPKSFSDMQRMALVRDADRREP